MTDTSDPQAERRRRLAWRATHRGTREMDLVMTAFVNDRLAGLDEAGLDQFEAVVALPDTDLMDWFYGRAEPPAAARSPVLDLVLGYRLAVADYRGLT